MDVAPRVEPGIVVNEFLRAHREVRRPPGGGDPHSGAFLIQASGDSPGDIHFVAAWELGESHAFLDWLHPASVPAQNKGLDLV